MLNLTFVLKYVYSLSSEIALRYRIIPKKCHVICFGKDFDTATSFKFEDTFIKKCDSSEIFRVLSKKVLSTT